MKTKAIAYLRTSSAANVGADKDSERRQRAAIAAFAKTHGYEVVDSFYDAAVSGADPVGERPGFKAMMDRIAGDGVRVIIVESPDRFARDLAVQIAGHDYLKELGVALVPTSAPDFFAEDTPTAVLVRQVLGAIAQFEKASLVAKMKAGARSQARRDRREGRRPAQLLGRSTGIGQARAQARAPAAQGRAPLAPADFRRACRCRTRQRQRLAVHRDVSAADAGAVSSTRLSHCLLWY